KNVLKHVHPAQPNLFQQVSHIRHRIHSVAISVAHSAHSTATRRLIRRRPGAVPSRSSNEFDAANKNVLKHVHPAQPNLFQQVSHIRHRIHSVAISVAHSTHSTATRSRSPLTPPPPQTD
ncbi:MAG TPA: hypothetical protein VGD99_11860, partial [Anaerolineae bacterium]